MTLEGKQALCDMEYVELIVFYFPCNEKIENETTKIQNILKRWGMADF